MPNGTQHRAAPPASRSGARVPAFAAARAAEAENVAPALHSNHVWSLANTAPGVKIRLPARSVADQLEAITLAAYRSIGSRPLTVADQLSILEEHQRALERRLQNVAPMSSAVVAAIDEAERRIQQAVIEAGLCVDARRELEEAVPKAVRHAAAVAVRRIRFDLFKVFERRCVRAVLLNTGSIEKDPVAPPATALQTFAQLEMLAAHPRNIGGPVYMRWLQLKRCLPLTDVYYDIRDAILDPATVDVDTYAMGRVLRTANGSTSDAIGAEDPLGSAAKMVLESDAEARRVARVAVTDVLRRQCAHMDGGVPMAWESISAKIMAVALSDDEAPTFEALQCL